MIIVLEFAESEELLPIVLPLVHEESEKLLQLLVDTFGLAICLWVICGRGCQLYADEAIELAGEVRDELGTAVRDYDARGTVVLPDLAKKEASCSDCCDSRVRCDEVRALRDAINDVHDSVVAVGAG
jgi:hypothetical protein